MASFYDNLYASLSNLSATKIANAFQNAQNTLNGNGAPPGVYLDLQFDGLQILRFSDGSPVITLTDAERFALYPHLDMFTTILLNQVIYP